MLVNIYNESYIPVVGEKGPLFGYNISEGVFSILKQFTWLEIRRTTEENARLEKEKYSKRKAEKKNAEAVRFVDKVTVIEEPVIQKVVEPDELDKEIDKLIEESPTTSVFGAKKGRPKKEEIERLPEEETANVKKYSNLQLRQMTKKELKAILIERGHTNDEYTGRYHDTVEVLIKKVKATQ